MSKLSELHALYDGAIPAHLRRQALAPIPTKEDALWECAKTLGKLEAFQFVALAGRIERQALEQHIEQLEALLIAAHNRLEKLRKNT